MSLLLLLSLACRTKDVNVDTGALVDTGTFVDEDGDGVGAALDCDDANAAIFPGAEEICDGLDNNCDGVVDTDAVDAETWYIDSDGDGFGSGSGTTACQAPFGTVSSEGDCDDGDTAYYPGAPEDDCTDPNDYNCDGSVGYEDADGDGYAACEECDDANVNVSPDAEEFCDGIDNDCNGFVDEDSAVDASTWYRDLDTDGYGDSTSTDVECYQPSGYVSDTTDCDDASAASYPGASEICDGSDNDCNGDVDEDPIDGSTFYTDADGDGYGDPDSPVTACEVTSGTTSDNTDCEDGDATAYPGTTTAETPGDGVDQNCDGNDGCSDLDCDGLVDLVFADYYGGSSYDGDVYLYYNDGGGYSDADRDILTNSYGARDVEVADLDGDGFQDIVVASYYDSNYVTQSYVYWGSSSGYSDSDSTALATYGTNDVDISDLDGDGYQDLVFANYYGSAAAPDSTIYWGSSTGYSSADSDDLETDGAWEVEISDLDGDGYEELVFAAYYDGSSYSTSSYIYWGSASGYSTTSRTSLPTLGARDVEIADFDGDGLDDIALSLIHI